MNKKNLTDNSNNSNIINSLFNSTIHIDNISSKRKKSKKYNKNKNLKKG